MRKHQIFSTVSTLGMLIGLLGCKCPQPGGMISKHGISIIVQPEDQFVKDGDSAAFFVVAEPPPLTYQWKKNDMNIPDATNSIYKIAKPKTSDVGFYTCVVTRKSSVETQRAALTFYSVGHTGGITSVTGPFQPGSASKSCVGPYLGYVKFKATSSSIWFTPTGGSTSATVTDRSTYTTKVEAIEFPTLTNWCATNSLTFPVRSVPSTNPSYRYAFTTYFIALPVPTAGQAINLNIEWKP